MSSDNISSNAFKNILVAGFKNSWNNDRNKTFRINEKWQPKIKSC